MGKTIFVTKKLANGEIKKYQYDKIRGIPVEKYQKELFRINYVAQKNHTPKHCTFSTEIQQLIHQLHSVGIGVERIVKIIRMQHPQTRIGSRAIKSFLLDPKTNSCTTSSSFTVLSSNATA